MHCVAFHSPHKAFPSRPARLPPRRGPDAVHAWRPCDLDGKRGKNCIPKTVLSPPRLRTLCSPGHSRIQSAWPPRVTPSGCTAACIIKHESLYAWPTANLLPNQQGMKVHTRTCRYKNHTLSFFYRRFAQTPIGCVLFCPAPPFYADAHRDTQPKSVSWQGRGAPSNRVD